MVPRVRVGKVSSTGSGFTCTRDGDSEEARANVSTNEFERDTGREGALRDLEVRLGGCMGGGANVLDEAQSAPPVRKSLICSLCLARSSRVRFMFLRISSTGEGGLPPAMCAAIEVGRDREREDRWGNGGGRRALRRVEADL